MTSIEVLIEVGNNLIMMGELEFGSVNFIQYKGIVTNKLMVGFNTPAARSVSSHTRCVVELVISQFKLHVNFIL